MRWIKQFGWLGSFVVVAGLVLDQLTKFWIVQHLRLGETWVWIKDLVYLTYVKNEGAGFSMLSGMGMSFFVVVTLVALVALCWWLNKAKNVYQRLGLFLVISGALGNLIDRLFLGYVRDFIGVYLFGWPFPIFNVADIFVSVGIVGLILVYWWEEYGIRIRRR